MNLAHLTRFSSLKLQLVICLQFLITLFGLTFAFTVAPTKNAHAAFFCCVCCNCCGPPTTQQYADNAYQQDLRDRFILGNEFFQPTIRNRDFRAMSDQFVGTLVIYARMIGGFYDAQAHSEAQLALQELSAEAARDYIPSEAMCQFGTLTKSLAATDDKRRANQLALSEVGLARSLGTYTNLGSGGGGEDINTRIEQYQTIFCDKSDNKNSLGLFCAAAGLVDTRFNRDINYARTLGDAVTLNIDFTNPTLTNNEHDLVMLAHNLYGQKSILKRMTRDAVEKPTGQGAYIYLRAMQAKRAVAQNSFSAIAAMKSAGVDQVRTYLRTVMSNIGMSAAHIDRYLASGAGVTVNPSYYSQMDILTKRIYQDPRFYAELMEGSANVDRQTAAMESLELMQGRDIFNSMSRSEQLLSQLVEMEAMKLQQSYQNRKTTK